MSSADGLLHHLILNVAGWLSTFHHVAALVGVLDVAQAERTTAVLVARELRDGRACIVRCSELDHTSAARALVGLHLDLRALDLADRLEQLDEILIARAPRQL